VTGGGGGGGGASPIPSGRAVVKPFSLASLFKTRPRLNAI